VSTFLAGGKVAEALSSSRISPALQQRVFEVVVGRAVVTNSRTRARGGLFEGACSLMVNQRAGIRAQDGSCG